MNRVPRHLETAKIRTPDDLYQARQRLGWSYRVLARALRMCPMESLSDDDEQKTRKAADRLREMERGARELTGPVCVAIEAIDLGFRPEGFEDRE